MGFGPHLTVGGGGIYCFSQVTVGTWPILSSRWGCSLNTCVFSAKSGLLSGFQGHLGVLLESWQGNRDASQVEDGDP